MSCTQNISSPTMGIGTPPMRLNKSRVSFINMSALCSSPTRMLHNHKFPRLVCSSPKNKICAPIYLFGGKRNSRGENKAFSWDSLKDAVQSFRQKNTVQEFSRDQKRRQELGGGDGDENPPGRLGGGGGGSDDTEGEGFAGALEETLQVFLATISLILVYIYMIRGAELFKLARDYIRYLFGGVPTMRLQLVMDKWSKALDMFSYDMDESDDWLERLIVTTPTWWHRPEEIVRAVKSRRRRDHQQN